MTDSETNFEVDQVDSILLGAMETKAREEGLILSPEATYNLLRAARPQLDAAFKSHRLEARRPEAEKFAAAATDHRDLHGAARAGAYPRSVQEGNRFASVPSTSLWRSERKEEQIASFGAWPEVSGLI